MHMQTKLSNPLQIAGLNGIVPGWWFSGRKYNYNLEEMWKKLEFVNTNNKVENNTWTYIDNGEFYGFIPSQHQNLFENSEVVFLSVIILSSYSFKCEFHFDILYGYRLYFNRTLIKDMWLIETPSLENGACDIQLEKGINFITLAIPSSRIKIRNQVSGQIICDKAKPADLKVITPKVIDSSSTQFKWSPFDAFREMTAKEPLLKLNKDSFKDFKNWKMTFKKKFLKILGPLPERLPSKPFVEEKKQINGIIREKVWIQAEKGVFIPMFIHMPEKNREGKAIVALHGHGNGKNDVAGIITDKKDSERIKNNNYGIMYAKKGYITITPDFRNFGERRETLPASKKDQCDIAFFRYVLYGGNSIKYQISDIHATIDYLLSRKEVNPDRIGVTGLSYGGRMSMYAALTDDRIKVCVSSGAMNLYRERLAKGSSCGNQFIPGLLTYGDTIELFSSIAPKPLMLQLGTNDNTSPELYAIEMNRQIKNNYKSAGVEHRYAVNVFNSGHKYVLEPALEWFEKWL